MAIRKERSVSLETTCQLIFTEIKHDLVSGSSLMPKMIQVKKVLVAVLGTFLHVFLNGNQSAKRVFQSSGRFRPLGKV